MWWYLICWYIFGVMMGIVVTMIGEKRLTVNDVVWSVLVGMIWPVIPIIILCVAVRKYNDVVLWKKKK